MKKSIYTFIDLFKAHIPHCWQVQLSAQQLKGYLQDDFGINTMVMGSYSLEGWEDASYHPNTLSTAGYNPATGVLSDPVSPGEYDNWLRDNTDYKTGGTD